MQTSWLPASSVVETDCSQCPPAPLGVFEPAMRTRAGFPIEMVDYEGQGALFTEGGVAELPGLQGLRCGRL